MTIEFLLRLPRDDAATQRPLAMARRTLDAMAAGGIYDHLGGGFARYATDAIWLVPHFEKMLYDNAQLARVYLHAWQLTGDARYREVAEETLDFVERELLTDGRRIRREPRRRHRRRGGRDLRLDAAEIEALLGDEAAGVQPRLRRDARTATGRGTTSCRASADVRRGSGWRRARGRLLDVRRQRPQPARDDKVLTAWNGLMIAAFADAARGLRRAATGGRRRARGRSHPDTSCATTTAACAGRGRTAARSTPARSRTTPTSPTGCSRCTRPRSTSAGSWPRASWPTRCWPTSPTRRGGFFDTADDHEALIARPKGLQDNAVPSGSAMAATVLLRLAAFTGEARYRTRPRARSPGHRLRAALPDGVRAVAQRVDVRAGDVVEIAIAGDPGSPEAQRLWQQA